MNRVDLSGRNAVVTGGARDIGLAIAERFIKCGASVAIWDRDGEKGQSEAKRLGQRSLQVDVGDERSVAAAMRRTEDMLGAVDILVTTGEFCGSEGPVEDYPIDDWRQVLETNLTGPFLCARAVIPGMRARDYGRIVHLTSPVAESGAACYSAANAGILALTKSLGIELASSSVIVNAIAPGVIKTEQTHDLAPADLKALLNKTAMRRLGKPSEVASLVAWLASEECSFSTGTLFDISGGAY